MSEAPTTPTHATAADWRAQVDKDLARTPGASFEKTLVHTSPEGIAVQPLYTEAVAGAAGLMKRAAGPAGSVPARLVAHLPADATAEEVATEIEGGVDGLWLPGPGTALAALEALPPAERPFLVLDVDPAALGSTSGVKKAVLAVNAVDHLGAFTEPLRDGLTALVSTLPYHPAGGDAADELGIAWATGRAYLAQLLSVGMSVDAAARAISFRVTVGRDTFAELAKLRALRFGWAKLLTAAGVREPSPPRVHAVSALRTMTRRDPWVNLLRVTTQTFAAICGGADFVSPAPFDAALPAGGPTTALGRRVARNTCLVLRDESFVGRVEDPAAGSYFFEAMTVELARRGWSRFQALEKEGGVVASLASGALAERLATSWKARVAAVGKRRAPILGVSEFAQLAADGAADHPTKAAPPALPAPPAGAAPAARALPQHRDAEDFEALRDRVEASGAFAEVLLVTTGTFADSRGRVGFARQLLAAGGFSAKEAAEVPAAAPALACLCGSDESYAAEALARARALKAAGCRRLLLAGRPRDAALEADLRRAGIDDFVFVGCDALAVLSDLASGISNVSTSAAAGSR